ncbi:DUF333 domain-containing protein [Falsihalocynthiibacter sp. SS001]|uniref:DUF333 domain-containing protein n=1 Tax=Falsihalocynthiibacter sp. SS001 TaxID=3349698 RepID=UPI0036D427FB
MKFMGMISCAAVVSAGAVGAVAAMSKQNTEVSNPAADFCVESGGTYEIRDEEGGQTGYCMLASGETVDAWEYYRANAPSDG